MNNTNFEHNDLCVGIDLGTTNSVLATINEKPNGDAVSKVVEIPRAVDMFNAVSNEAKLTTMKKPTLPSCVYYRQDKNYEPLVGDFAKTQYPLRPHLVAKSIKSQMGFREAKGLTEGIPDKSPAEISARILKHLLKEASKVYRCEITDAVITVPANFDSVMCKATRDAAELAGIKVKNLDGTERPVLLSEPNAVIYDLINQIHNGEISNRILDLNDKKRVLVFDLGGGTLDITMHEIMRREDAVEVLKVDEIATNRYTLLGGDDFDEEIAKAMYVRYLKQYEKYPDAVKKLQQEKEIIMAQLRVYAENLKLDINENGGEAYDSGWDDEEETFPIGGNMGGIGYAYDDSFAREEVEEILSVFMAEELSFDDYRRITAIKNTKNIIYPILDVLQKASEKLGTEAVVVDAVIVNGGMSKFYMVTDRLKKFFGFDPIVALDPDQAVARGAAVYHYYLHKYEQMQDDMKLLGVDVAAEKMTAAVKETGDKGEQSVVVQKAIQWGNTILNDSLYLGVKNGVVQQIIPTGVALPYTSEIMKGFRIEPEQNRIAIPIKSRNLDGTYRTIAMGNIDFTKRYREGAYVAFKIHMDSSKVITMKAWTSTDADGNEKVEEGYVEIAIDSEEKTNTKTKFMPPSGAKLDPKAELHNLMQLCENYEKYKVSPQKSVIAKRIAAVVNNIAQAGNKEAFAEPILERLRTVSCEEARHRLFILARKIGNCWTEAEKVRLANVCMNQINGVLQGFSVYGPRVTTNTQALYTLMICANEEQLRKVEKLHKETKYLQPCLYLHAKTRTAVEWLKEEFEKDVRRMEQEVGCNLQFSTYAIGMALRKDGQPKVMSVKEEAKIVKKICQIIGTGNISAETLTSCVLALGFICDQRTEGTKQSADVILKVLKTIREIGYNYPMATTMHTDKTVKVVEKMINGDLLNAEEEKFLLTKLDI